MLEECKIVQASKDLYLFNEETGARNGPYSLLPRGWKEGWYVIYQGSWGPTLLYGIIFPSRAEAEKHHAAALGPSTIPVVN